LITARGDCGLTPGVSFEVLVLVPRRVGLADRPGERIEGLEQLLLATRPRHHRLARNGRLRHRVEVDVALLVHRWDVGHVDERLASAAG
jgi:hypothetical protein